MAYTFPQALVTCMRVHMFIHKQTILRVKPLADVVIIILGVRHQILCDFTINRIQMSESREKHMSFITRLLVSLIPAHIHPLPRGIVLHTFRLFSSYHSFFLYRSGEFNGVH